MIKLKILDKELTMDEAEGLFDELCEIFGKNKVRFVEFPVDPKSPHRPFPETVTVSYGCQTIGSIDITGNSWFGDNNE